MPWRNMNSGSIMYEVNADQHLRKLNSIANLLSTTLSLPKHVLKCKSPRRPTDKYQLRRTKGSYLRNHPTSLCNATLPSSFTYAYTTYTTRPLLRLYTSAFDQELFRRKQTTRFCRVAATTLRSLMTMQPRNRTKAVTALCATSSRRDPSLTAFSVLRL